MPNPPVQVGKIVIGDGSVATAQVYQYLPTVGPILFYLNYTWHYDSRSKFCKHILNLLDTTHKSSNTLRLSKPHLCRTLSSSHILKTTRSHLCQYDVNLTYPQTSLLPSIPLINPTERDNPFLAYRSNARAFLRQLHRRGVEQQSELTRRGESNFVKRDSSQFFENRPFDQLDPWVRTLIFEWNGMI